jgi:hypothetical protein
MLRAGRPDFEPARPVMENLFVETAIGTMLGVIKPLGTMLTTLPARANDDGLRAGPSFAFYRSVSYLPHREAAWALFDERFEELSDFCGQLAARDNRGLGLGEVHKTIQALAAGLKKPTA